MYRYDAVPHADNFVSSPVCMLPTKFDNNEHSLMALEVILDTVAIDSKIANFGLECLKNSSIKLPPNHILAVHSMLV